MNGIRKHGQTTMLHGALLAFAVMTLFPFLFVLNSSFRTNTELYHGYFGVPDAFRTGLIAVVRVVRGNDAPLEVTQNDGSKIVLSPSEALRFNWELATLSYRRAWSVIRPYMINALVVCFLTAAGVLLLASVSAYVLSRYRFFGHRFLYYFIICTMMFPAVLTLVPSFLLVKQVGLLNSYWAMVLPYVAGGQVFAIFVLKSFFDGLPEELFEAARIDGAGHFAAYRHIVLPLSKPVLSVVLIMNILGTWNNFLWPFIVNSEGTHHVVSSGLYVLATSAFASNMGTLFAAYMLSSIPLLILFVYATRPFIQGVTSGAFKA
jgi:ABC-type glycerol-3-phosphate transport system permease component